MSARNMRKAAKAVVETPNAIAIANTSVFFMCKFSLKDYIFTMPVGKLRHFSP